MLCLVIFGCASCHFLSVRPALGRILGRTAWNGAWICSSSVLGGSRSVFLQGTEKNQPAVKLDPLSTTDVDSLGGLVLVRGWGVVGVWGSDSCFTGLSDLLLQTFWKTIWNCVCYRQHHLKTVLFFYTPDQVRWTPQVRTTGILPCSGAFISSCGIVQRS